MRSIVPMISADQQGGEMNNNYIQIYYIRDYSLKFTMGQVVFLDTPHFNNG